MFKIGIVGTGLIAGAHAKAIAALKKECMLAAVADVDEGKAKAFGERFGAPYFTDYRQMAEKTELDAVILNLPHFLHCEVSVYFLEHGINVLVEKPMANTVAECDAMIAAAEKSGTKLAVGHVQRYYESVRRVKEIIETEKYGKLCMIREVRCTDYTNEKRPRWFLSKKLAGGGISMNFGAHSLDRLFYTTGRSVERIHSVLSNPVSDDDIDVNAQIFLKLSGGVAAVITLCGAHVPGEFETAYYFTNGVVKIINGSELVIYEEGVPVNCGGGEELMYGQMIEFIKLLKGEPTEIATPEYGREIIRIIEEIQNQN